MLIRVGFPEKASGRVVAATDTVQKASHATGRIAHPEGLRDPVADLLGGEGAAGGDLLLEAFHLGGAELAGIAPPAERAEGVQPLSSIEAEPLADLAGGDAEVVSDLLPVAAVGGPEDSGEAVGHPLVQGERRRALIPVRTAASRTKPITTSRGKTPSDNQGGH